MKHILAIIDHVYEDLELWYPKIRLEEEGFEVVVAAPKAGAEYTGKHGYPCISDAAIADVSADVGIKDDMVNAGAEWLDEALVIDGNQISSRTPDDLHLFAKALAAALK
ncbi:MAG: DJ-1/PfpI family protein [Verrucomicrobia bacterium]|nr:DJ-1/PfpI family protein [Verrucomicrobiota bacterium]